MNKITFAGMLAVLVCAALASGCASKTVQKDEYSGYLGNGYSQLKEAKDPKGDLVLRYISPDLNPGKYSALMLDPLVYHPVPKPTEQVSAETLREIGQYLNRTLRSKFAEKVRVVDQPGPGVARLSIAFTAVRGQDESLSAYQYIPVAFVITMGARAVEGQAQQAKLLCESLVVDSVSGERLAMQVRSGTGESLKNVAGKGRVLTLEAVKPLIDLWIDATAEGLNRYIKAK
jgi:hypothetical protein